MSPEEKALLVKVTKVAEENNAILKKMRRGARIRSVLHLFYWVLVIGLSFGAYYFIEPYIGQLQKIYSGLQGDVDNLQGAAKNLGDFSKLLQ